MSLRLTSMITISGSQYKMFRCPMMPHITRTAASFRAKELLNKQLLLPLLITLCLTNSATGGTFPKGRGEVHRYHSQDEALSEPTYITSNANPVDIHLVPSSREDRHRGPSDRTVLLNAVSKVIEMQKTEANLQERLSCMAICMEDRTHLTTCLNGCSTYTDTGSYDQDIMPANKSILCALTENGCASAKYQHGRIESSDEVQYMPLHEMKQLEQPTGIRTEKRRWGDTKVACLTSMCGSKVGSLRLGCLIANCGNRK